MKIWAVIPMKPLCEGKSRLSAVLSQKDRKDLVLSLFENTIQQLSSYEILKGILIVSADRSYETYCDGKKIIFLPEETINGLNVSINLAVATLKSYEADAMLVVHGDLPLLTKQAFDELFQQMRSPGVGIIPDRHIQGTNILLTAPPNVIDFYFGHGSFQKHQAAAQVLNIPLNIIFSDTLSVDIDNPEDLIYLNKIT